MPSKDAIHFTTNLRPEHHDRLLAEANRRGTSRNDVIRTLIDTLPDPWADVSSGQSSSSA